jgi:hypothetical protein
MKQSEADLKTARLTLNVLTKIRLHKRGNPIVSRQLEEEFSITGERVRELVRLMRREGTPIGACSDGYFYADTYDEIESTIEDLRQREESLRFTRIALLKKFNLGEGLFA